MSNAIETLEGWYCFNDFRKIDWKKWRSINEEQRQEVVEELMELWKQWTDKEQKAEGDHAVFQILGHKADIMFMYFRPTLKELNQIELEFNKTKFAEFTVQTMSYVSVVELSNYLPKGVDPYSKPEIRARLFTKIPNKEYICFYPMNKLRSEINNWYMLSSEERKQMMGSHSLIGRQYAGNVKQIILGSVGLDDYEWGIALFSDDPIQFKKLIYEMRFDEVSARFGEFGSFYIGRNIYKEHFNDLLKL